MESTGGCQTYWSSSFSSVCVCLCVCVYVWEREKEGEKESNKHKSQRSQQNWYVGQKAKIQKITMNETPWFMGLEAAIKAEVHI